MWRNKESARNARGSSTVSTDDKERQKEGRPKQVRRVQGVHPQPSRPVEKLKVSFVSASPPPRDHPSGHNAENARPGSRVSKRKKEMKKEKNFFRAPSSRSAFAVSVG